MLEWNGRSLANKRYDEVRQLVSDSYLDPQVELRVARVLTNPPARPAVAGVQHAQGQQPADMLNHPGMGGPPPAPNLMGTRIQVGAIIALTTRCTIQSCISHSC